MFVLQNEVFLSAVWWKLTMTYPSHLETEGIFLLFRHLFARLHDRLVFSAVNLLNVNAA